MFNILLLLWYQMSTIVSHVQCLVEHDGNPFTVCAVTDWIHFNCLHRRFVETFDFHIIVGSIDLIYVLKYMCYNYSYQC